MVSSCVVCWFIVIVWLWCCGLLVLVWLLLLLFRVVFVWCVMVFVGLFIGCSCFRLGSRFSVFWCLCMMGLGVLVVGC